MPGTPCPTDNVRTPPRQGPLRWAYWALGWLFVGLAALGTVLPVLPTTPLLLVAAWAFARSSPRLAAWLRGHRRFGPLLRDWEDGQRIPLWAKIAGSTVMAASLAWLVLGSNVHWAIIGVTAVLMALGAAYVWSRPGRRPAAQPRCDG